MSLLNQPPVVHAGINNSKEISSHEAKLVTTNLAAAPVAVEESLSSSIHFSERSASQASPPICKSNESKNIHSNERKDVNRGNEQHEEQTVRVLDLEHVHINATPEKSYMINNSNTNKIINMKNNADKNVKKHRSVDSAYSYSSEASPASPSPAVASEHLHQEHTPPDLTNIHANYNDSNKQLERIQHTDQQPRMPIVANRKDYARNAMQNSEHHTNTLMDSQVFDHVRKNVLSVLNEPEHSNKQQTKELTSNMPATAKRTTTTTTLTSTSAAVATSPKPTSYLSSNSNANTANNTTVKNSKGNTHSKGAAEENMCEFANNESIAFDIVTENSILFETEAPESAQNSMKRAGRDRTSRSIHQNNQLILANDSNSHAQQGQSLSVQHSFLQGNDKEFVSNVTPDGFVPATTLHLSEQHYSNNNNTNTTTIGNISTERKYKWYHNPDVQIWVKDEDYNRHYGEDLQTVFSVDENGQRIVDNMKPKKEHFTILICPKSSNSASNSTWHEQEVSEEEYWLCYKQHQEKREQIRRMYQEEERRQRENNESVSMQEPSELSSSSASQRELIERADNNQRGQGRKPKMTFSEKLRKLFSKAQCAPVSRNATAEDYDRYLNSSVAADSHRSSVTALLPAPSNANGQESTPQLNQESQISQTDTNKISKMNNKNYVANMKQQQQQQEESQQENTTSTTATKKKKRTIAGKIAHYFHKRSQKKKDKKAEKARIKQEQQRQPPPQEAVLFNKTNTTIIAASTTSNNAQNIDNYTNITKKSKEEFAKLQTVTTSSTDIKVASRNNISKTETLIQSNAAIHENTEQSEPEVKEMIVINANEEDAKNERYEEQEEKEEPRYAMQNVKEMKAIVESQKESKEMIGVDDLDEFKKTDKSIANQDKVQNSNTGNSKGNTNNHNNNNNNNNNNNDVENKRSEAVPLLPSSSTSFSSTAHVRRQSRPTMTLKLNEDDTNKEIGNKLLLTEKKRNSKTRNKDNNNDEESDEEENVGVNKDATDANTNIINRTLLIDATEENNLGTANQNMEKEQLDTNDEKVEEYEEEEELHEEVEEGLQDEVGEKKKEEEGSYAYSENDTSERTSATIDAALPLQEDVNNNKHPHINSDSDKNSSNNNNEESSSSYTSCTSSKHNNDIVHKAKKARELSERLDKNNEYAPATNKQSSNTDNASNNQTNNNKIGSKVKTKHNRFTTNSSHNESQHEELEEEEELEQEEQHLSKDNAGRGSLLCQAMKTHFMNAAEKLEYSVQNDKRFKVLRKHEENLEAELSKLDDKLQQLSINNSLLKPYYKKVTSSQTTKSLSNGNNGNNSNNNTNIDIKNVKKARKRLIWLDKTKTQWEQEPYTNTINETAKTISSYNRRSSRTQSCGQLSWGDVSILQRQRYNKTHENIARRSNSYEDYVMYESDKKRNTLNNYRVIEANNIMTQKQPHIQHHVEDITPTHSTLPQQGKRDNKLTMEQIHHLMHKMYYYNSSTNENNNNNNKTKKSSEKNKLEWTSRLLSALTSPPEQTSIAPTHLLSNLHPPLSENGHSCKEHTHHTINELYSSNTSLLSCENSNGAAEYKIRPSCSACVPQNVMELTALAAYITLIEQEEEQEEEEQEEQESEQQKKVKEQKEELTQHHTLRVLTENNDKKSEEKENARKHCKPEKMCNGTNKNKFCNTNEAYKELLSLLELKEEEVLEEQEEKQPMEKKVKSKQALLPSASSSSLTSSLLETPPLPLQIAKATSHAYRPIRLTQHIREELYESKPKSKRTKSNLSHHQEQEKCHVRQGEATDNHVHNHEEEEEELSRQKEEMTSAAAEPSWTSSRSCSTSCSSSLSSLIARELRIRAVQMLEQLVAKDDLPEETQNRQSIMTMSDRQKEHTSFHNLFDNNNNEDNNNDAGSNNNNTETDIDAKHDKNHDICLTANDNTHFQ